MNQIVLAQCNESFPTSEGTSVRGTFRDTVEKDRRKLNLKLIFQKKQKRTEMRKNDRKGEIRTCPKIVAQPAVTSEKGVVFNPVRSDSGVSPTFSKLTCSARASLAETSLL